MSVDIQGMTTVSKILFRRILWSKDPDGELWYETGDGAIQFMRWIRKRLAVRAEWEKRARGTSGKSTRHVGQAVALCRLSRSDSYAPSRRFEVHPRNTHVLPTSSRE